MLFVYLYAIWINWTYLVFFELSKLQDLPTYKLNKSYMCLGDEDVADEGAGDQLDNNSLESDDALAKGVGFFFVLGWFCVLLCIFGVFAQDEDDDYEPDDARKKKKGKKRKTRSEEKKGKKKKKKKKNDSGDVSVNCKYLENYKQ